MEDQPSLWNVPLAIGATVLVLVQPAAAAGPTVTVQTRTGPIHVHVDTTHRTTPGTVVIYTRWAWFASPWRGFGFRAALCPTPTDTNCMGPEDIGIPPNSPLV